MKKEVKISNSSGLEWYNNPNLITSFIIGLIALIVLLSQSFAIKNNLSPASMLGSILNHNIMYLLVCIYFIALKTNGGKKYFDFFNVFLLVLYSLSSMSSLLTVFQSFGLSSLLGFSIDILILIYLFHTLLRSTRVWKSANLGKSPFNEISNNGYFNTIIILAIILLAVDLISSTSFDGTILTILDTFYIALFVRYIYLYSEFLDRKKISIDNIGNFDEVKYLIEDKVNDLVEEFELKEKYEDFQEKIDGISDDIKDNLKDLAGKVELDERLETFKESVSNFTNDVRDEFGELKEDLIKKYKDSELDEKVDKAKDVVSNLISDVKEEFDEIKEDVTSLMKESNIDDVYDEIKNNIIEKKSDAKEKTNEIVNDIKNKISTMPKKDITSRKKGNKKNINSKKNNSKSKNNINKNSSKRVSK